MSMDDPRLGRRRFLTWLSVGLSGLIAALVGVPIVGYLLGPLIEAAPGDWRSIGPVGNYPVGRTKLVDFENPSSLPWSGTTSKTAVWVRQTKPNEFVVFSVHCSHLGCPVNWLADADLFICPCHGGVYYEDGTVAAGPPPRPLFRYETRIENATLYVKTMVLPTQYIQGA